LYVGGPVYGGFLDVDLVVVDVVVVVVVDFVVETNE